MYTSKIVKKEVLANGNLQLEVEFSNGTKTITETCIPQNRQGFEHWVTSRLASLNSCEELVAENNVGVPLDFTPQPPTKTADEIARELWFQKYFQWIRIKTGLVDTGIVPLTNPRVQAILNDLKTTLKVEYIDFI